VSNSWLDKTKRRSHTRERTCRDARDADQLFKPIADRLRSGAISFPALLFATPSSIDRDDLRLEHLSDLSIPPLYPRMRLEPVA
jgi:hypothetical protein